MVDGVNGRVDLAISERAGSVIGPYTLLEQIGEGGMGVVFMAEQTQPLERTVAMKIIKPGMDTRHVIARFEAERQALAMMDHPNIAQVLDAGTTESGRPYFVMELVKGVSITKYCDDRCLPVRARLELLLPVCQAVQHAHQKGIIHRDIKPSNILVAEYDDRAVPKVIDFGVAKASIQKNAASGELISVDHVFGAPEATLAAVRLATYVIHRGYAVDRQALGCAEITFPDPDGIPGGCCRMTRANAGGQGLARAGSMKCRRADAVFEPEQADAPTPRRHRQVRRRRLAAPASHFRGEPARPGRTACGGPRPCDRRAGMRGGGGFI